MPLQPGNDFVFLNALELKSIIGPEAWHRSSRIQPVVLDIRMQTDLMLAANTDDVLKTVHYGNLCKAVTGVVEDSGPFESLREFAQIVTEKALRCGEGGDVVDLSATLPKGLLLAEGIGISTRRVKRKDSGSVLQTEIVFETLFVRNMKLACIIGVNPHERLEKQFVVINLAFYDVEEIVFKDYAKLIKKISDVR
jgi:FolB domain-containing protein